MKAKKRNVQPLFHIALLILALMACTDNRFEVDLSNVTVDSKWHRMDREVAEYQTGNYREFTAQMQRKYGSFYNLYLLRILNLGHVQDPAVELGFNEYVTDEHVQEMFASIQQAFPDVPVGIREKTTLGFRHYAYYFPNAHVPDVVLFATNFTYNVVAADSLLGIGLEHYLGPEHPIYSKMGMQQYRVAKARPELIPFDAVRGWLLSEYQGNIKGDDLLSLIIEYGKVLYLMDAFFPGEPDAFKIGYTQSELEWAQANEWQIWSVLLEKEVLYSDNGEEIRRYTGEGPFTGGFPHESPSQLGYWIGWQIVRSYMNENPNTGLPELMKLDNAQEILRKSGYKPKK
jgi:hypothetical protein